MDEDLYGTIYKFRDDSVKGIRKIGENENQNNGAQSSNSNANA